MYPDQELSRLADHKARLRRDIATQRIACVQAAAQVARPLAWLDRVMALWRRLPPLAKFAAVPLGILFQRAAMPRRGWLGSLTRWGPLAFSVLRAVGAAAKTRRETAATDQGHD